MVDLSLSIVNFKQLPFSAFDDLKERADEIKLSFTDIRTVKVN